MQRQTPQGVVPALPAASRACASSSSGVNRAGSSGPSATRAAPVSVAASSRRSGRSWSASVRASASTRRPSASVLPISTVLPLRIRIMSPGRKAVPAMLFSTAGIKRRRRTGRRCAMTSRARASMSAAPPMSFFIRSMPLAGLMSRPPVSKHTPLPTSVRRGCPARPRRDHQARLARAGAADGVDRGIALGQERVTHDGAAGGPEAAGEIGHGLGQLRGAEVTGGRVDEVARLPGGFGHRGGRVEAGALDDDEARALARLLAVALEAVGGQRPAQGRGSGGSRPSGSSSRQAPPGKSAKRGPRPRARRARWRPAIAIARAVGGGHEARRAGLGREAAASSQARVAGAAAASQAA